MIAEIKRLNPKPGLKFGTVQIQPVLPDVMVRPARDGSWMVELNNDTLPRVLVNRSYYTTVSKTRALRAGPGYLRRLPAERQLAGQEPRPAGAHDPARGRGDRAPAGRLPHLRHRAPEAAQPEDGGGRHLHARIDGQPRHLQQVHGDAARHLRAQVLLHLGDRLGGRRGGALLRGRAPPHPPADRRRDRRSAVLSDDKIVEQLKRDGIDIARRTVAKYREALRIPSSVQRRREKQMAARLGASA